MQQLRSYHALCKQRNYPKQENHIVKIRTVKRLLLAFVLVSATLVVARQVMAEETCSGYTCGGISPIDSW